MAKLSARGRTCLVEAVREYDEATLQRAHDKYEASYKPDYVVGSDLSLTIWERSTRRLMSDGKILEKRDVRFRPVPNCTWEDPAGRRHSYGWKVKGKLKAGLDASDFVRIYREPKKDGNPSPWTVKTSGIDENDNEGFHRSITLTRVMQALEDDSDGHPGFCLACGADADGCEPDAREYKCESCGQHKVYGAEEVLMMIA